MLIEPSCVALYTVKLEFGTFEIYEKLQDTGCKLFLLIVVLFVSTNLAGGVFVLFVSANLGGVFVPLVVVKISAEPFAGADLFVRTFVTMSEIVENFDIGSCS